MKKNLTKSIPETSPLSEAGYIILEDGTPAKRLRPLVIGERRYYNLPIGIDGKPKRVPAENIRQFIR